VKAYPSAIAKIKPALISLSWPVWAGVMPAAWAGVYCGFPFSKGKLCFKSKEKGNQH
jgi:hypothetical protein